MFNLPDYYAYHTMLLLLQHVEDTTFKSSVV